MTSPSFTAAELLALPAVDLRDMVIMAPGDSIEACAAYLGLDISVPEHRAALAAAGVLPADPEPIEHTSTQVNEGVKATLTPDRPDGPTPDTGEGTAPEPAQNSSQPFTDIGEMLAAYRGTYQPFLVGTFAMYSASDGGLILVTDIPDRGTEQHTIPAKFVRLALAGMSGKGPIGRLLRG